MDPQQKRDILGNEAADAEARKANDEGDNNKADEQVIAQDARDRCRLKMVAKVIGTMLQMWPSNKKRLGYITSAFRRGKPPRLGAKHEVGWLTTSGQATKHL